MLSQSTNTTGKKTKRSLTRVDNISYRGQGDLTHVWTNRYAIGQCITVYTYIQDPMDEKTAQMDVNEDEGQVAAEERHARR
jgi:hypothetical protein